MSHAAATIEGYTVVGQSAGTTALSGQNAKETVTYSYSPKSYTVRVTANNDASTQDGYVVPTYQVTYGSEFALSTLDGDIGTKAGYTFGGWYYDSGTWAQPVPATFTMPASNVFIYAKWDLAPITLSVDLSAAGLDPVKVAEATPLEFGGAVNFAKPAFTDIEGYVFVDYYTDATYTTKVTWPLSVTENTTVYARLENVNGKITFDSNGGTPVDTINYTSGNAVPAPQDPTREGYAFTGWFYDAECTQSVAADDGEIWKYGKSLTRNTMTGFVAMQAGKLRKSPSASMSTFPQVRPVISTPSPAALLPRPALPTAHSLRAISILFPGDSATSSSTGHTKMRTANGTSSSSTNSPLRMSSSERTGAPPIIRRSLMSRLIRSSSVRMLK